MLGSSQRGSRNSAWRVRLGTGVVALLLALPAVAEIGPYLGVEAGASINPKAAVRVTSGGTLATDAFSFRSGLVGGAVAGYALPGHLRPELEVNYRRNNVKNTGLGVSAITIMGNAWYDFEANRSYFYLGGGIGDLHLRLSGGGTGATDDVFGGQLGTGAGFFATPELSLGIDYRYAMGFSRASYTNATQRIQLRYRSQTVMLGIRYSFGDVWRPFMMDAPAPEPVHVVPLQQ